MLIMRIVMKITVIQIHFFFLTFLPRAVIFCCCAFLFLDSIWRLMNEYVYGVPILVITPEAANGTELPAVTICAPREPMLNATANGSVSFDDILHLDTIQYWQLFAACFYVETFDPRQLYNQSCHVKVVPSVHYGMRKCFTFRDFTVPESVGEDRIAVVVVNMTRWHHLPLDNLTYHNVAYTVHGSTNLPLVVEQELVPLRPGYMDTIIYERVVTSIDPGVHRGFDCRSYDEQSAIRSEHDCLQLCVLKTIYRSLGCLDSYTPISEQVIAHLASLQRELNGINGSSEFCPQDLTHFFVSRMAQEECTAYCMPSCRHLLLGWGPHSLKESVMGIPEAFLNVTALIALLPSHQAYLSFQQQVMIDFYNFIGYFGGHSHFWLGLSIVTLYDFIHATFCWLLIHFRKISSQHTALAPDQSNLK